MQLTDFTIEDYLSQRKYINLGLINNEKSGYINTLFLPYINQILTQTKLSYYKYYVDNSSIDTGLSNIGFIASRYQFSFEEENFGDIPDILDYSINECIDILNDFTVRLPFSTSEVNNLLLQKKRENKIIPMGYDVDYQYKYMNSIKALVYFEDDIQIEKECQLKKLNDVLQNVIKTYDYTPTDITQYDLSTKIFYDNTNIIIFYQDNTNFQYLHKDSLSNFLNDFTNLFRKELIDNTIDYTFINHDISTLSNSIDTTSIIQQLEFNIFDTTRSLFKTNISGDNTSSIISTIIPTYIYNFMGINIIKFFKSTNINNNEFSGLGTFTYGDYLYKSLKYYYGFDSTLIDLLLKLRLAWIKKRSTESVSVTIVGSIIEQLTGVSIYGDMVYTQIIKTLETDITNYINSHSFGFLSPIIYHDSSIDHTIDITVSQSWSLDDIYQVFKNIDLIKCLYILDFGYDSNLLLNSFTTF